VGGAVSDAYATVRSSFEIIRSTVGTAGCFAVAVIILPPLLNIIILRAVMWTVSAAAELFSEDSMSKLAKALDNGLAVAQSVLICYGLMFILSTGILLNISGG
ncbi:stage III sporulation protein AE, partial [Ruminococcus flavefaciens]|uniref:stage III sporulation protein AE n=1 Tax=Ruminococcus flavefaciens TaxID=1265 RepID=UPI000569285E